MEGNLLKWTNYWLGWQCRWFVLRDGILSYYNTQSESKNGAFKRSYKVSMFDIIVSKDDNTRLDLIVANDQHLYLKALDYKERQKWLVALASHKAQANSMNVGSINSSLSGYQTDSDNISISSTSTIYANSPYEATNMLKIKKSELRLYCDLLTQQSHEMKSYIQSVSSLSSEKDSNETTSSKSLIDVDSETKSENQSENEKKLDELTSNINVTCDMLIKIVRNLIILSNTSTNVGPAAITAMLDSTLDGPSSPSYNSDKDPQYLYHLYHPLYTNYQLNNYKTLDENSPEIVSHKSTELHDDDHENFSISSQTIVTDTTSFMTALTAKHSTDRTSEYFDAKSSMYSDDVSIFSDYKQVALNKLAKMRRMQNQFDVENHEKPSPESIIHNHPSSSPAPSSTLSPSPPPHLYARQNDDTNSYDDDKHSNKPVERGMNFNNFNVDNHSKIQLKLSNEIKENANSINLGRLNVNAKGKKRLNNLPYVHKPITALAESSNHQSSTFRNVSINSLKQTSIPVTPQAKSDNKEEGQLLILSTADSSLDQLSLKKKKDDSNEIADTSSKMTIEETILIDRPISFSSTDGQREFNHFFNMITYRFTDFKLEENDHVPCSEFLECCNEVFCLIDKFGTSAFIPVRVDVYGNIEKLRQKHTSNPKKFRTLQSIIQSEIEERQITVKNSATLSLLWLNRAILFLREFLHEFSTADDPDMSICVQLSYQKTLKPYHNWVVRSIFSLAVRSVPDKKAFLQALAKDEKEYHMNQKEFEDQVKQTMRQHIQGIDRVTSTIRNFYLHHNLEKQLE